MNEFESEISRIRLKYQTGQIDQATYLEELKKISELEEESKNPKPPKKVSIKSIIFVIFKEFWIPIIFLLVILFFFIRAAVPKEYEIINSLAELPDPVQENLLGGRVEKVVFGKNVDIIYGAEYTIYGRVIGTYSPLPTNVRDAVSPMDIALSWGFLAQDTYDNAMIFTSLPSRFLRFETYHMSVFNGVGGMREVGNHLSNNHVIPKDSTIKTLLKKVQVDDFIKLEGYLVTVQVEGDRYPVLQSSAVRTDSGAGACEVMYVTDIKWLKEK